MLTHKNSDDYSTKTTEGRVPHIEATVRGIDLSMPVKLRYIDGLPVPLRDDHGYIYALPGGGQISLNGEIK